MAIPSAYPTVDALAVSVQRSAALPLSQNTFTSDDIIAFLDEEQKTTISDLVHAVREEFWVVYNDQQIQPSVYEYSMPQRALAGGLRDVVFVDASGNEIQIALLAPEQIKTPAYFSYRPAFQQQGCFIKDAKVILWPQNSNNTAYTLRQKYERRPNTLTSSTNCAQITAIDTNTKQVSCQSVPATWTTALTVDVISNYPQFVSIADDQVLTNVTGSVLTFSAIPTGMSVGQWICPAGTTCIPQIPLEAYTLLIALGTKRVLQAMQNPNGFQIAAKDVDAKTMQVRAMLTPRVEGQPKKLVNSNVFFGPWGYPFFR